MIPSAPCVVLLRDRAINASPSAAVPPVTSLGRCFRTVIHSPSPALHHASSHCPSRTEGLVPGFTHSNAFTQGETYIAALYSVHSPLLDCGYDWLGRGWRNDPCSATLPTPARSHLGPGAGAERPRQHLAPPPRPGPQPSALSLSEDRGVACTSRCGPSV